MNKQDRDRLASVMDMLAAVQLDIRPLRDVTASTVAVSQAATIREVSKILRTAMDDLREVVRNLDLAADRP